MGSIYLSPKHGVNPSIGVCYFCGEENGEIVLPGRLRDDREAPRKAVWHKVPCNKCKEYMSQGIILISVRDGASGDNPYRTGGWAVVTEEAIRRVITTPDVLEHMLKMRSAFIEDKVWDTLGPCLSG